MDSELRSRIDALYASVGAVTDWNIENYPALVIQTKETHGVVQHFNGDARPGELENALQILIYNVAGVNEVLKKWATDKGKDKNAVQDFLAQSEAFCIIRDLADRHRHPYPRRGGGYSQKGPKLGEAHGALQLIATAGQPAAMMIGADGVMKRSGAMTRIITADVTDEAGNQLGDAHDFISRAVTWCEAAMSHFEVMSKTE